MQLHNKVGNYNTNKNVQESLERNQTKFSRGVELTAFIN